MQKSRDTLSMAESVFTKFIVTEQQLPEMSATTYLQTRQLLRNMWLAVEYRATYFSASSL